MQSKFIIDSTFLFYVDSLKYIRFEVDASKYKREDGVIEQTLTIEYFLQYCEEGSEDFYDVDYVKREEITTKEQLKKTINSCIRFSNETSDLNMSPLSEDILNQFVDEVWSTYDM